MTTYRTAQVHGESDWVVIATRSDNSQESLTKHQNEAEARAMADRFTAITLAKGARPLNVSELTGSAESQGTVTRAM
jgi:hypothetical protein